MCQDAPRRLDFGTCRFVGRPSPSLYSSVLIPAIAGERLRQHYGQQDARYFLKRTLKLRRGFKPEPSPLPLDLIYKSMMSIVCFGAPYAYLRHINEFFMIGVGRTDTITERWQAFVDENVADWTNTNLVVCVTPQCVGFLIDHNNAS